ncbi:MAG TPA: lantibiotic dehydratase [Pyrinomonadaceae bacterium]|nr:lantibiotic dehydratase [Pyrinomonadaceae bacterium]
MLRTPLLPLVEFLKWSDGLEAVAALNDPERFEDAYVADCEKLRKRLKSIITRPEVRDGLFLASPNIIERFHFWTGDPNSERGRKVEHVLVRYFSRMTGRATPFGLFAGISSGVTGDQTNLALAERAAYRRSTQLNMDYLYALTDGITRDSELRRNLIFRPNTSLYRVADRVHYVESRLKESERSYHLVAVEETEYLAATLERAVSGATPEALAAALTDDAVSLEEAREFIAQLIDGQILVPDIGLNVSGPAAADSLIEHLAKNKETAEIAIVLQCAQEQLKSIDCGGLGIKVERYRQIANSLEKLPVKVDLSRLFHVDMVKPAPAATLGSMVLKEINRGIEIVHKLSSRGRETELTEFRKAFFKRYEYREVPLVEALDEEIGVGFGNAEESSPLLRDLDFPSKSEETRIDSTRHAFNLRKLVEALSSGAREIIIDEAELEQLTPVKPDPLPDSFAFEATVAARSPQALAGGDFRLLIGNGSGPSAALSMGRFCHADENLKRKVKALLRREEAQRPEAIFAEIVHLPEGKLGNIASRPLMRDYEIPYLARSVVPSDHQIPITDLCVSVRNHRIRLRSTRLNREVIPRMTNAHYYSWRSPAVYRFLCLLQDQDTAWLKKWDWGALETAPFLPRVCSGRLVLSLARWHVRKEELQALAKEKGAARFRALQSWCKQRGLPRLVRLADRDYLLPVDFENVLSVESFVQLAKDRDKTTLLEFFPEPDELCASGPEGSFVHELIVPFLSEAWPAAAAPAPRGTGVEISTEANLWQQPILTRRFPPGSEWLYVKLYTGPATADRILRNLVKPFVKHVKRKGDADCWFFIRLSDPDYHLRLRFHGEPNRLRDRVQPLLKDALAPFIADNRIWRAQFDTYDREVDRYGGAAGIVLSERLFQIDSEAVLELIDMLDPGDAGADERWMLTVYGIDRLLDDFGIRLKVKHSILLEMRNSFAKEVGLDQSLRIQLNEKFRKERQMLQTLLVAGLDGDHPLAPGLAALRNRSRQLSGIVRELRASEQKGRLSQTLPGLMPLYIHMHVNRLLRYANRAQELVIYHLLTRLYESQLKSFRPLT